MTRLQGLSALDRLRAANLLWAGDFNFTSRDPQVETALEGKWCASASVESLRHFIFKPARRAAQTVSISRKCKGIEAACKRVLDSLLVTPALLESETSVGAQVRRVGGVEARKSRPDLRRED